MDFLLERMTRQGLASRGSASPATVAASALGLQAQDVGSSRLGVRARTSGVDEAGVVAAYAVERSVVRSWLMRATVHLVAAEDVRWLVDLFGPMIQRRFRNVRWRQLGIDDRLIEAAIPHTREVLAGRELTRHEIAAALAERGIRLADDGQAATHLLLALSCRGVTCRAGDRGRDSTFALLDDWVPGGSAPADPLAELARRYFLAFGPATAADFTTWSGLPAGAAIKAIRDELTEVEFDSRRGWTLGTVEPVPGLRLLPMFDNYLIGYRDRTAMLDPALHPQVYVGGIIKATVVCDGRVIGIWRLDRTARSTAIRVSPFEPFKRRHRAEIERERADLERFLGRPVSLAVDG
ncbi:MAG TPA: winged helix DNA-binding domain-containing protein [Jatrophihabitans sp.]|nr:winged helix DNA-binding domain-containing protein [Jatrophihabitans sp.]